MKVYNNSELRVQAQLFVGRTLIDTGLLDPGETQILATELPCYDIFLKNAVTGWEIARKLDSESSAITLCLERGRYVIVGGKE